MSGGAVICRYCGNEDEVSCAGMSLAPTPEIVQQVCERDACPSCRSVGTMAAGRRGTCLEPGAAMRTRCVICGTPLDRQGGCPLCAATTDAWR